MLQKFISIIRRIKEGPSGENNNTTLFKDFFLLFCFNFALKAIAGPHQIFFFGDSLSDSGNNGVFTNAGGPLWSQIIASQYNLKLIPSKNGGTNFAWSGAQTDGSNNPAIVDVVDQIDLLVNQVSRLDSGAFYFIWVGANDLINVFFGGGNSADEAASNVISSVNTLHNNGAKYILVNNIPNIGNTPFAHGVGLSELLNSSSNTFNALLLNQLNALDYNVVQLDIAKLFQHIIANPTRYGFRADAATAVCTDNSSECNGYLFIADGMHPTTSGHRVIADYVYSILTAPQFYAGLADASINALVAQNKMLDQNITALQRRCFYKPGVYVFGGLGYAPYWRNPFENRLDYTFDSDHQQVTLGLNDVVNTELLLGAAIAFTDHSINYDHQHGSFELQSTLVTLFTSYFFSCFYVNGLVSVGVPYYKNIDRRFNLGTHTVDAKGKTDGFQYGMNIKSGYFVFNTRYVQSGPLLNIEYQRDNVNGYSEESDEVAANIIYNNQRVESLTTGLGYEAKLQRSFSSVQIITTLFALLNKEWRGGERTIYFHLTSLPGSHGELPVVEARPYYSSAGINLITVTRKNEIFSIGYYLQIGENGMQQHLIQAVITIPFM